MPDVREVLNSYYGEGGIHPLTFACKKQHICRFKASQEKGMIEAKMSMVGSEYGKKFPRIAMISLDPPSGENQDFVEPYQRTVEYVSDTHADDDYTVNHPNPHWSMTQIIVKDILKEWGYPSILDAAVVEESYQGRPIDNVSRYFAHVNAAKCSMNKGTGSAPFIVHCVCSTNFLAAEIEILKPEILITQGVKANRLTNDIWVKNPDFKNKYPFTYIGETNFGRYLWMPMYHPTRKIGDIRKQWPIYIQAVRNFREDAIH